MRACVTRGTCSVDVPTVMSAPTEGETCAVTHLYASIESGGRCSWGLYSGSERSGCLSLAGQPPQHMMPLAFEVPLLEGSLGGPPSRLPKDAYESQTSGARVLVQTELAAESWSTLVGSRTSPVAVRLHTGTQ